MIENSDKRKTENHLKKFFIILPPSNNKNIISFEAHV